MSTWEVVAAFVAIAGVILLVQSRANAKREAERSATIERDEAFWKNAKLWRATIESSMQFGLTNLKPNFQLRLRIEAPDGAYEVDVEDHVDYADVGRMKRGEAIGVWVDPAHRDRVKLASASATEGLLAKADDPP